MLKIILNEFARNDYYEIGEEKDIVFLKHRVYDDFWIVSEKKFDLKFQSELYEQYISRFAKEYPTVKKNTSLIILVTEDARDSEKIVSIENDPYLFKKYVLSYSKQSLDELKAVLTAEDGNFIPIESLMMKPDVFNHLKGESAEGGYHLLYSIAHKLPILPINVNHQDIIKTNLQLNGEQRGCLEWCMMLSEDEAERKTALEQFSEE